MDNQQPAQIDEAFLDSLGFQSISPEAKESLLNYVKEELQLRIGVTLAENLSEEQLDEFEQLMTSGPSQQVITEWLSQNCPNYQNVVKEEVEAMRSELNENRDSILSGQTDQSAEAVPDGAYI